MVVINLHETEYIEDALTVLAEAHVRECVVQEVDGVASHHLPGKKLESSVVGSISGLFKQDRNINKLIMAVTDEDKIEEITEGLKKLYKTDRWAASFWFMPIQGYFYHK